VIAPSVAQVIVNVSEPFSGLAPLAPAAHNGPDFRWLLGLWACGFLGVAWMRFQGLVAIRAAIRSSVPVHLPALPANIDVRSSPGMLEPSVIGWLHSVLLLPAGIADRLTDRQFEAVLKHELCHIGRRDNLTSAIHMLVEMLFWFHPLVWWIGARMMEERECACDEAVLSQGSEPSDYAEGILSVCKLYVESPLRSAAGVTGSDLKKRIRAILTRSVARDLTVMKKAMLGTAIVAAVALPVWVGIIHTSSVRAQGGDLAPGPRFEVASIRPCDAGEIPIEGGDGKRGLKSAAKGERGPSPDRLNFCAPLQSFLMMAYAPKNTILYPDFIQEGPAWIRSARYQINAKAESPASRQDIVGPMLQALLEDRFKLKFHRETREVQGYALTVTKRGLHMPRVAEEGCIPMPPTFVANPPPIERICGPQPQAGGMRGSVRVVQIHGYTLTEYAQFLSGMTFRPVVDKTGIQGRFDYHLEFVPDDTTPGMQAQPLGPADPSQGPSLFTAIQEQLGLKLEPAKAMREYMVIDHVERPSEN
jgi:uncharacterized protein (TIGR03435 family)